MAFTQVDTGVCYPLTELGGPLTHCTISCIKARAGWLMLRATAFTWSGRPPPYSSSSQATVVTKVHYKNQNGDHDGYFSPGSGRLLTFSSTGHYKNQNGKQDGYCSPGSGRILTFSSTGHYKNQNGNQDGYGSPGSGRLLTFSSTVYYHNQNGDQDGYCSPGSGRLLTFSSTRTRMVTRMPTVHQAQVGYYTGHYKKQNGDQDGYCSPRSGRLLTFSSTGQTPSSPFLGVLYHK